MHGTAGFAAGEGASYDPATNMIAMDASIAKGIYDTEGGSGRRSAVGALSNEITHILQDQYRAGYDLDVHPYSRTRSRTKKNEKPIWQAVEYMRTGRKGKFGVADSYRANTERSIDELQKRFDEKERKYGLSIKKDRKGIPNWVDESGDIIMPVVISGRLGTDWQSGGRRGVKTAMQELEWESTLNDYLMTLENRYEGKFRHSGQKANGKARGFVPNFNAAMELNNSYSRAGTRVVNLKGIGLANTEETLGHHPSFTQPFVNPPEGSREGMLHKMRAVSQTGINPYSIPNTPLASQGSIPEIDTSGAQSSLGSLAQEFDNLKTALAQGGFIPDASGSSSGTSTVTNNMSIYSNGGIPTGGSANGPDIAGKVDALIAAVKTNPDLNKQLQNKLLPSITRR